MYFLRYSSSFIIIVLVFVLEYILKYSFIFIYYSCLLFTIAGYCVWFLYYLLYVCYCWALLTMYNAFIALLFVHLSFFRSSFFRLSCLRFGEEEMLHGPLQLDGSCFRSSPLFQPRSHFRCRYSFILFVVVFSFFVVHHYEIAYLESTVRYKEYTVPTGTVDFF